MEISQNTMQILNNCQKERKQIIIKGMNGIGQPFITKGIILNSPHSISNWNIKLDFSQRDIDVYGDKRKQFAPFRFDTPDYDEHASYAMYIKSIANEQNEVIFENPIFDELMDRVIPEEFKNKTKNPLSISENKLVKLIGRPVIYKNNLTGVLTNYYRDKNTGVIMLTLEQGGAKVGLPLKHFYDIALDKKAYQRLEKISKNNENFTTN